MSDQHDWHNNHEIRPIEPQLLQPTDPNETPDTAPGNAPQTQYAVNADAPNWIKEAAAALAERHWNRGQKAGYTPLPPAGVKVGDDWVPANLLLPA